MQELEETGDTEEQERLKNRLRALQKPSWRFVVINSDIVNAFVTPLLPGYVFVHRGLLRMFEGKNDQVPPTSKEHAESPLLRGLSPFSPLHSLLSLSAMSFHTTCWNMAQQTPPSTAPCLFCNSSC